MATTHTFQRSVTALLVFSAMVYCTGIASASTIAWTDWQTQGTVSGSPGSFVANGTLTTLSTTVDVTYTNLNGVSFYQTGAGGETDFWTNNLPGRPRIEATSPYTSDLVDNIPTGTDIIALEHAGSQTLAFSQTVANPVFSYVSLNGNGYAFLNQDFDILSFGSATDGNDCGYWGCGTSFKSVVDLGDGNVEYRLLGTGEPHGTIRFKGAFDTVTWRSLSDETWNGFTVGVEGTAQEIFAPEPSTTLLLGAGMMAIIGLARKRSQRNRV